MKVQFYVNTGYVGGHYEEIIELPDDFNEEDLETTLQEYVNNRIESGYEIISEKE